jgi:hypothetical protein
MLKKSASGVLASLSGAVKGETVELPNALPPKPLTFHAAACYSIRPAPLPANIPRSKNN